MNIKGMLPRTRFCEYLVGLNNLDEQGFEKWVFQPGMLFHSTHRWWGNGGRRDHPHEGLDLCLYRDRSGNDHTLDETIRINKAVISLGTRMYRNNVGINDAINPIIKFIKHIE